MQQGRRLAQKYHQNYAPPGFQGQNQGIQRAEHKRSQSFEDQILNYMAENKRILNLHEHKFVELAVCQANTTIFQTNTNASLKNLDTQVGQLAQTLQNQYRDSFLSETKTNPKDYMAITLRGGKELQGRKEVEKNYTDVETQKADKNERGIEKKQYITELTNESEQLKKQNEQKTEEAVQKKKKKVRFYQPPIPFPQRLKQSKLDDQFSKFLNMFRKLEINIPFAEALAQMLHYEVHERHN